MERRALLGAAAILPRRSRKSALPLATFRAISVALEMAPPRIIVAGAGPVGVVAALASAQKGLSVSLFETQPAIDDSPRAATTHPATLEMLDRLGLIDEYIAQGLVARYVEFWERPTPTR